MTHTIPVAPERVLTREALAQAAGDPAVRPAQLQVLVVLATRLDSGEWVPVPAASVAAQLGVERASVARALQRLCRSCWLVAGPKRGRVITYRCGPRVPPASRTVGLTPTAQRVARELEQVLDTELPRPVSHAQLARDLGISRGSVQAGIEQLVTTGALLRGPREGRTYTYRLPHCP
ncbi:hypothetical protein [Kocuria salsicia]|uniref:hypothetical protein n=1 Tax=Kocuria salsicia TaxID=664639 RepID=UPI0011A24201|nr:hypothetical protein [Kocuria salsicia]